MKRLHIFVLFFHSYFVYANQEITTVSPDILHASSPEINKNPAEMRPLTSLEIHNKLAVIRQEASPGLATIPTEMRPMASPVITSPVEIRPVGAGSFSSAVPNIRQSVALPPPPSSLTSDGWNTIMQVMRETISEQTNEINSLKLRVSIIENKLKNGGE